MAVIKLKQSKLDELNDKGILYNQSHTSAKVQETKPLFNLPVRETAKTSANPKVAAIDAKIAENRAAIKAVQNSNLDDYNKKLEIAKLNTNHSRLVQEKTAADPNLVDRLWAGFGNIITTSAGGMTAASEVAKDVINGEGKSTGYDPNSRSAQYLDYANQAKETALAGTSGAGRFLGEALLSVGQTASTLPLAAINPALPMLAMGATAGGTKAAEVKQQGGTSNEALIRGTLSGAIEGLMEAIPVANLFKLAKSGGTSAVKSVLKQAGIEATEEGISYMLNLGADKLFKDPNAEFSLKELATAAGMGALSGGIMGTGAVGVGKVNGSNVVTPEAAAQATPNREVQYLPGLEPTANKTTTTEIVQPKYDYSVIERVLGEGKINNTDANAIISNPDLSSAFTNITGVQLEGTTEQKRNTIRQTIRDRVNLARENEALAMEAAMQAEEEYNREKDAQTVKDSGYRSYIRGLFLGGATIADAKEVINNPVLKAEWESVTGKTLPHNEKSAIKMIRQTKRNPSQIDLPDIFAEPPTKATTQNRTEMAQESVFVEQPKQPTATEFVKAEAKPAETVNVREQASEQPVQVEAKKPTVETLPIRERTVEQLPIREQTKTNTTGQTAERGYAKNIASDNARNEAVRKRFQEQRHEYTRLANKDVLERATAIMDSGFDNAKTKLEQAIGAAKSGMKLAPEMVPLSKMVADQLAAEGNIDEAERILSDIAVELTEAGQLGHAAIILRDASPMSKIQTLEKAISKINEEGRNRYKDKWKDLALSDAEKAQAAKIQPGDEAAFEALYEQVAKRLGSEIPSTMWEKLTEVRKVFMLLNPKTQIRNVAGNATLMGVRKVSEKLSGAIQDRLVKSGKMNADMQTRTSKVSKESREIAKQLFEKEKASLMGQADKWDVNSMAKQYRKYFGDSGAGKTADAVREFTYKLLEAGDHPFLKSAFVDSAAQYIEAHGIKDMSEMTQEGVDFATQQALEATFRDFSEWASILNKFKKKGVGGAVVDVLLPFTTTPINIAKRTFEYSPAGLVSVLFSGEETAQKIDAFSKGLTGSGVVLLGALLAKYGFATAGADENKDKAALDKATGTSPYSIAGKVSYEWAQPIGTQLAMGAAAWDAAERGEGLKAIWEAIKAGGDVVMDMTIISNIKDLFSGYGSPTETILDTLTSGVASQMTPSILGTFARVTDPTVRASSNNEGFLQSVITGSASKIPGASKTLPASINVKGEENKRVQNGALRFLQETINPANVNTGERNAVDDEIYRLYEKTGELSVFPKKATNSIDYDNTTINLTAKEKMAYQETLGKTYYTIADAMMDSDVYKNASAKEQVEYLNMAEAYATQTAKREIIGDKFETEKYFENAKEAKDELGLSEAEFLLYYEKYGGTTMNGDKVREAYASGIDLDDYLDFYTNKGKYDADGNKSYTNAEIGNAIKGSNLSEDDQIKTWLVQNPKWAETAEKIGVSAKTFVKYKVATMGFEGKQAQPKIYQTINTLDIPESDRVALRIAKAKGEIS